MNNRDRVMMSLRHEKPDRVPYSIGFTAKAREQMARYLGNAGFEKDIDNCLNGLSVTPKQAWREVAPGVWEDEFGVQWNRTVDRDIGVVCNTRVTHENLDRYEFPDPGDPSRYEQVESWARTGSRDNFTIVNIGFSLFERAWTLAGMETILMDMVTDPGFVHALLDRIAEHNLSLIDRACRYPIDAMMFGDDWGQQTGLIMGPERWREFIKPRVARMYARVKEHGKRVFIHSCGKVDAVFPDLIEIGLDVFNPFQPEVMDVGAMKRRFGDRLTFFGGISTQKTLPYSSVAEVRAEVRRLLAEVGRDGGYIAAPAHATPGDARPENIAAMLEVLRNQS